MGLRDRIYTPRTAKALLSPWRIALAVVVAVVLAVVGLHVVLAVLAGIVAYVVLVAVAMPKGSKAPPIDPFAVGEPWRHHVQGAVKARRRFDEALHTASGARRQRLAEIGERIDTGVQECWRIATRGDEIDSAVSRLELQSARSDLQLLQSRPQDDATRAMISSLQSRIDSGERLKAQSAEVAQRLRLMEVRLAELAARASEVAVGTSDQEAYRNDVDDLIAQLEGMRLALEETERLASPPTVDFGTTEPPGAVSPPDR